MKGTGIKIDDNYELAINLEYDQTGKIVSGLVIGDVTNQNQLVIIRTDKGELKEHPTKGVGIEDFIDDESPENLIRTTRTELSKEGMEVKSIVLDSKGELLIDAKYKQNG